METIDDVAFERVIEIPYDPEEERLFKKKDSSSIYHKYRLPLPEGKRGRQHLGNFAEIVVLRRLEREGYQVLVSESQPIPNGYILGSFTQSRKSEVENYARMFKHFDPGLIEEFNRVADLATLESNRKRIEKGEITTVSAGGGDPDLFAYRRRPKGDSRDRVFVEVKRKGEDLRDIQKAEFPVIRSVLKCEVWLYRIEKRDSAR